MTPTSIGDVAFGTTWVYRRSDHLTIEQVTVTSFRRSNSTTPLITVCFASGESEDVPAHRLKTLWENEPAYTAAVARWGGLATRGLGRSDQYAAGKVFFALLERDTACMSDGDDTAM